MARPFLHLHLIVHDSHIHALLNECGGEHVVDEHSHHSHQASRSRLRSSSSSPASVTPSTSSGAESMY